MFQDAKDSEWTSDSKLEPVDLNKLDARKFIVYKFGCFVTDLVAGHCQHAPITLLLADKIPPNERLRNNAYRNSFFFDANNRILYVRTARLDTVGEFVVVLVHTLAHIKAGEYLKLCLSLYSQQHMLWGGEENTVIVQHSMSFCLSVHMSVLSIL